MQVRLQLTRQVWSPFSNFHASVTRLQILVLLSLAFVSLLVLETCLRLFLPWQPSMTGHVHETQYTRASLIIANAWIGVAASVITLYLLLFLIWRLRYATADPVPKSLALFSLFTVICSFFYNIVQWTVRSDVFFEASLHGHKACHIFFPIMMYVYSSLFLFSHTTLDWWAYTNAKSDTQNPENCASTLLSMRVAHT